MTATCQYVLSNIPCERLAFTEIDGRKLCWNCALLVQHEKAARISRDLSNERLSRKDVTLPIDLRNRLRTYTGMLSNLLEHAM